MIGWPEIEISKFIVSFYYKLFAFMANFGEV